MENGFKGKRGRAVGGLYVPPFDDEITVGSGSALGIEDGAAIISPSNQQVIPDRSDKMIGIHLIRNHRSAPFQMPSSKADQPVRAEVQLRLRHAIERKVEADVHRTCNFVIAAQTAV